jgi:hypothetical protein
MVIRTPVVQHRRVPACLKLKASLRVFVDLFGSPSAFCSCREFAVCDHSPITGPMGIQPLPLNLIRNNCLMG